MSSPAQLHPHTGSGVSPPQGLLPLPDTSPCVGHHQAGRRAAGRMEGRAPRRQMDLSGSGGGKEGKPMLNGVQKGVEPTPVTCRGGRAQGTPPPCMQEHHGAAIPWGGPRPDPGGCRAVGDRTSQRPHPGQATATMSHAGAAPAAAPLPGTRWPGCAWSTEPRPPPPGDTRKVTAPRGQDPAPCGAGGTAAPQNPPTQPSTLTPGLKGWSRVTSSSTGCPKGFSAEPGSYMEKAWRSRRCGGAVPGGCPCSGRSLGAGVGCAGPVCCRICVFSACSLWICSREKGEGISEEQGVR